MLRCVQASGCDGFSGCGARVPVAACRLGRLPASGTFQDPGSNPWLLHWQADFLTTGPPGKWL